MKGHNFGLCRKCDKVHTPGRGMLGKKHSSRTRFEMSQLKKGKSKSPEHRRNISLALKGKPKSEKARLSIKFAAIKRGGVGFTKGRASGAWRKGKTYAEIYGPEKAREILQKRHETLIKKCATPEEHIKRSKVQKSHWDNLSEERREERLKSMVKGRHKRPTRLEQSVIRICKLLSIPFRYTGDGKVRIGKLFPDFIWEEKKMIIEVYNRYYKSVNYEAVRKEYLNKRGYSVLFLTDEDIDKKRASEMVKTFGGGQSARIFSS